MTQLTILIPTMPRRHLFLDKIRSEFMRQERDLAGLFTVLYDDGDYSSIGAKRNAMVARVITPYMAFVDDDDMVSSNYVALILNALKSEPHCCSLRGVITTDGENPKPFLHSIQYDRIYEEDGVYYRPPNHLNTIRTEIVRAYPFPDWNLSEDSNFCIRMCGDGVLKKEATISEVLYHYQYRTDKRKLG